MLKMKLALYEDLLYQVHTYHHIVDLVNKVNSGEAWNSTRPAAPAAIVEGQQ